MNDFFDDEYKPRQRKLPQAKSVEQVHKSASWHMYESEKAHFLSIAEMHTRLARKTDNQEWITEAINRLKERGDLKSDEHFAATFIEQNYFGDYGAGRVYEVLEKKLIPKAIISQELANYHRDNNVDERQIVTNYVKSYYHSLEGISKEELTKRLSKRGFKHVDIAFAIGEHGDVASLKTKMEIKAAKTDVAAEIRKAERKHKGLRAIKASLQAKKVDVSNIEAIANELARTDQIDFYGRCHEALLSYISKKRLDITDFKQKSKCYGHLSQRGYDSEQIKHAFELYGQQQNEE